MHSPGQEVWAGPETLHFSRAPGEASETHLFMAEAAAHDVGTCPTGGHRGPALSPGWPCSESSPTALMSLLSPWL